MSTPCVSAKANLAAANDLFLLYCQNNLCSVKLRCVCRKPASTPQVPEKLAAYDILLHHVQAVTVLKCTATGCFVKSMRKRFLGSHVCRKQNSHTYSCTMNGKLTRESTCLSLLICSTCFNRTISAFLSTLIA